jgi:hypothetical protein
VINQTIGRDLRSNQPSRNVQRREPTEAVVSPFNSFTGFGASP